MFDVDGVVVVGIVDRNGHRRRDGLGRQYWPRIPNRRALTIEELGLHSDCQHAVNEIYNREWEEFNDARAN